MKSIEPYDATPVVQDLTAVLLKHVAHALPVSLRGEEDVELLAKAIVSELWRRGVRLTKEPPLPAA